MRESSSFGMRRAFFQVMIPVVAVADRRDSVEFFCPTYIAREHRAVFSVRLSPHLDDMIVAFLVAQLLPLRLVQAYFMVPW